MPSLGPVDSLPATRLILVCTLQHGDDVLRAALNDADPVWTLRAMPGPRFAAAAEWVRRVDLALVDEAAYAQPEIAAHLNFRAEAGRPSIVLGGGAQPGGAQPGRVLPGGVLPGITWVPRSDAAALRTALQHTGLSVQVERKSREARALGELTRALSSSLAPQEILLTVVERLALELEVSRVSLIVSPELPAPTANREYGYVLASSDDRSVVELAIRLDDYPEIIEALRSQAVIVIQDPLDHPLFATMRDRVQALGLGPLCLVPILWQGRAIGTFFIRATDEDQPLTQDKVRFCAAVADTTALALSSTRSLERFWQRRVSAPAPDVEHATPEKTFHAAKCALLLLDRSGIVVDANAAARELFELPETRKVDFFSASALQNADDHEIDSAKRALLNETYPRDIKLTVSQSGGKRFRCKLALNPVADDDNLIVASAEDISPTQTLSRETLEAKSLAESLIQSNLDAFIAWNEEGTLVDFSHQAEAIFGYRARDVVGKMTLPELLAQGPNSRLLREMLDAGQHPPARLRDQAVELVDRHGNVVPAQWSGAVLKPQRVGLDPDGSIRKRGQFDNVAAFALLRDLRPQQRAQARLAELRSALDASHKPAAQPGASRPAPPNDTAENDQAGLIQNLRERSDHLQLLFSNVQARHHVERSVLTQVRTWVGAAPFPIALCDKGGKIESLNTSFRHVLERVGLPGGAPFIGRSFIDALVEQDRPLAQAALAELEGGANWHELDLRLGAVQDDLVHLRMMLFRRELATTEPCGAVLFALDLSEVDELEEQIVQAEKLATLGQLAAGVVHELNNPLTSISVYSDYLLAKYERAGKQDGDAEKVRRIVRSTQRILRFTRDLVAYARPSTEAPRPASINRIAEQALMFCDHVINEHGAKVTLTLAPELPDALVVPEQIQQVLINLITNACHATTQNRGKLHIETTQGSRGGVAVTIADNGSGISRAMQSQIFEPFFSTKRDGSGTGLGLSIVRNIVHQHGGTIDVDSDEGRGTCFRIELPLRPPRNRRLSIDRLP